MQDTEKNTGHSDLPEVHTHVGSQKTVPATESSSGSHSEVTAWLYSQTGVQTGTIVRSLWYSRAVNYLGL